MRGGSLAPETIAHKTCSDLYCRGASQNVHIINNNRGGPDNWHIIHNVFYYQRIDQTYSVFVLKAIQMTRDFLLSFNTQIP